MTISEITCLWLQPQRPNFRTIFKTNEKEGFGKVADEMSELLGAPRSELQMLGAEPEAPLPGAARQGIV